MNTRVPKHLKKYIVEQNYNRYTFIDHACWNFIMKISINFFKKHAEKSYLDGLKKTGITIDKIPRISTINKKLLEFNWSAVCVRGFIPPQAFMEFQSLKILPIATDMRSHSHLAYTPSPDIVHEAAGHAPIITNKDYANYLINYGEIASKAIMSSEDMNLYYAIRDLSDIKEDIRSTKKEIKKCEQNLKKAYSKITFVSESAMLARMNWWTVEYGLVGTIDNPKIYGAGLLSSVAESENSFKKNVKKIPFSLKCLDYKYDITEQQPQLFITPHFKQLSKELETLSKTMSFKKGGVYGLKTAIKANTLCTFEIDNFIQVSGQVNQYIENNNNINFIKLIGPSQISIQNKQLDGHGPNYHVNGYSTPLGNLKEYNKPIHKLNHKEKESLNLIKNKNTILNFYNNITISGKIKNIIKANNRIILITLTKCRVKHNNTTLFKPECDNYDMICGAKVTSVYGGPADSSNYYNFQLKKSRYKKYNPKKIIKDKKNIILNNFFMKVKKTKNINDLFTIYNQMKKRSIDDWLLKYQFLKATNCNRNIDWINLLYLDLKKMSLEKTDLAQAIKRGLELFN